MNKNCSLKFVVSFLLVFTFTLGLRAADENNLEGRIRVKITPALGDAVNVQKSSSTDNIQTGIVAFDKLNEKYSVTNMKRVFPYSPKFEALHRKHGLHLWYELEVNSTATDESIVLDYSNLSEVTKAELRIAPKLIDPKAPVIYNNEYTTKSATAGLFFNDPMLDKQWHYHNRGQSGGTPGADINLFDAWVKASGSPNVIVAILDDGVETTHEDLVDAIWVNEAELNGQPGVDDDNNGFIDDVHGYNFASNNGNITAGFHATHVAGTIAATNNNGIGVCGIAGGTGNNDGVRIMSCQITNGSNQDPASAFIYAADNGAVIAQNSWGYPIPDYYEQSVLDAIDYFIEEAGNFPGSPMKGGVVIFAAGNAGQEGVYYPGAYEKCISVAALNSRNFRASYSNYGDWVTISAPGGDVDDDAILTGDDKTYKNAVLSTLDNNEYGFLDGTSMACPHVSGVAALIASKFQGSDFTNEELLKHLLTAYNDSIYDIQDNAEYIGKLGAGNVDADMALATDNEIAPNKVSDLKTTGVIAQDFVELEWTAPEDQDDGVPLRYEVIYSENEITLANLGSAVKLSFMNDSKPGDHITYEVSSLKPSTLYNFSVRYIDRWGNTAAFSNIISVTTNAGPIVKNFGDTIDIDINVKTENPVKKDSFILVNEGEGILRWDLETRHSAGIPYSVEHTIEFPHVNPEIYGERKGVLLSSPTTKIQSYNIEPDNNEEYSGMMAAQPLLVLGESNTQLPNSSASRFVVDNPEGFNLTHVDAYIELDEPEDTVIIEIYKGSDINSAKLLLSQEIEAINSRGYTRTLLDEQLFFEYNDNFWVVIHVPPGNLYPLGSGIEATPESSLNHYLSNDYGNTWTLLEELIPDNNRVWAVYAMSWYKKIDDYITLYPDNGELLSGDSAVIVATVDGEFMVDGNYKGNILVNTNEADRDNFRIPVDISIIGHDPKIVSPPRVDFGNVIIGKEKLVEFSLKNEGLSRFDIEYPYFEFTNTQFTYVQGVNREFDAGDEQKIVFKYTPTQAGVTIADATILDKNGDNHTFELFAVGLEPPVVSLIPEDTTYSNITIGDTIQGNVVISNPGKYTLDYFMPKFADGSNMEEVPENIHRFGYRTTFNPGGADPDGPAYNWTDISTTGVDITQEMLSKFTIISEVPYVKIDLGFNFPFFGINEDSIYITNYGYLTFDFHDHMWSKTPMYYTDWMLTDRHISATGYNHMLPVKPESRIYYQKYPDKLIVQYQDVPFDDEYEKWGSITFQIVLHENGNIYMYYKDIDAKNLGITNKPEITIADWSCYIGIQDQNQEDGVLVSDQTTMAFDWKPQSAVEIINPGLGLYYDLSKTYGSVKPGEADTITYKLNTDSLNVASYNEVLNIITSDPKNITAAHLSVIDVTGGGYPLVRLLADTLDFGKVFLGDTKSFKVDFFNDGRAPDSILTINVDSTFSVTGIDMPYFIAPSKKKSIEVSINTQNLGVLNDVVKVTTDFGMNIDLVVKGEIIPAPSISVVPAEINETANSGEQVMSSLTVSNPGDNELQFSMLGNEWVSISEKETAPAAMSVELPEFDYHVTKSTEPDGPSYEWVEIAETGLGTKLDIDPWTQSNNFSDRIDLPFTFRYYGVDYTSLYIASNGFVTFTEGQENADVNYNFGGDKIPDPAIPNNYIAPLWIGGGYDWVEQFPFTGTYMQVLDDRIIVEYKDFINGWGMGFPISFEVILYKTGNIKFQYKFYEGGIDANMSVSSIGIENQDGTKGIQIANRAPIVNKDMSILFVPLETYKVPAGGQKEFDVNLDARKLFHGKHIYDIEVLNNAPSGVDLFVPVDFGVYGTPEIEFPDSVDFGKHFVVEGEDNKHIKEFEIKNTGTASYKVFSLEHSVPDDFVIEGYTKGYDYLNGEPTWYWTELFNDSSHVWNQDPITILPKESFKLRVRFEPEDAGLFNDTLIIHTTIRNSDGDTVLISAEAMMPPVVNVDNSYLETYAESDNFIDTKSFILDNHEGGSDLEYSFEVTYDRSIELNSNSEPVPVINNFSSANVPQLLSSGNTPVRIKSTSTANELFNRILSYENASSADLNLGFGGGAVMNAVTSFRAPVDGFTLSHVQTWYSPGDLLTSDFKVNIYGGSLDSYGLICSQKYYYNIDEPDYDGKLVTIELDEPINFFPGETFYIEISYGKEQLYPQGLSQISSPMENTFFFGNGADYFDMKTDFPDYAWIIRAAELEYSGGSSWVVINSDSTGVIKPGEETTISVDFVAEYASQGMNKALLHIISNDPVTPDKVVKLSLDHNYGPQFELDGTQLSVLETDTITFNVSAIDIENDGFSISAVELPEFASASIENNNIVVTCVPQYEDAGVYSLKFEGVDDFSNTTKMVVKLDVLNKNRAPLAKEIETITIGIDDGSYSIKGEDIFSDPDNDEISVRYVADIDPVYETYVSGDNYLLAPVSLGESSIKFIGTDEYGKTAENIVNILVTSSTGTGVGKGFFEPYPNPATNILYFSTQRVNVIKTDLTISNALGQVMIKETVNVTPDRVASVDVSRLNPGIYFLSLGDCQYDCIYKFIKK